MNMTRQPVDARTPRRIAAGLTPRPRNPQSSAPFARTHRPLRDWVHRYNAEGIGGLFDRPHGGGAQRKLTAEQEAEVAGWVQSGPDLQTDGVVRWRLSDLRAKIAQRFAVHLHERSVGKLVRRLGFRRISVRPRHPQADAAAQQAHKKTSPPWLPTRSRSRRVTSRSSSGGRTKPASANRAA
jgi:transposase